MPAWPMARAEPLGLSVAEIRTGSKLPGPCSPYAGRARAYGVAFINDSKATNADARENGAVFLRDDLLDRRRHRQGGRLEPLKPLFPRVIKAFLIGEAAEEFSRTLEGKTAIERCGTLDRAVEAAARDAIADRRKGAVVLLSPACASFDQYPNFEVRGDAFVAAVTRLPGVIMKTQGADNAVKP